MDPFAGMTVEQLVAEIAEKPTDELPQLWLDNVSKRDDREVVAATFCLSHPGRAGSLILALLRLGHPEHVNMLMKSPESAAAVLVCFLEKRDMDAVHALQEVLEDHSSKKAIIAMLEQSQYAHRAATISEDEFIESAEKVFPAEESPQVLAQSMSRMEYGALAQTWSSVLAHRPNSDTIAAAFRKTYPYNATRLALELDKNGRREDAHLLLGDISQVVVLLDEMMRQHPSWGVSLWLESLALGGDLREIARELSRKYPAAAAMLFEKLMMLGNIGPQSPLLASPVAASAVLASFAINDMDNALLLWDSWRHRVDSNQIIYMMHGNNPAAFTALSARLEQKKKAGKDS